MSRSNFAIFGSCLSILALFPCMQSLADVTVYKESCGHNAATDWIVTCKVGKGTFAESVGTGVARFKNVQSITICAPFGNRGGLGPLTIVYNDGDGSQFMPTHVFETVKYRGSLLENRVSWVGASPRFGSTFQAQGELSYDERKKAFAYTEILTSGQKPIGEMRGACRYLDDQ